MRSSSRRLGVALTVALVFGSTAAQAQGSDDVERYLTAALRLYENLEYERALEQLGRAKQLSRGLDDDVAVALYEGVILADLGRKEESVAAFKTGLFLKPDARLPVKVSPKVEREFEAVRVEVKKELAPILARREAERKAKEEAEAQARAKAEADRRAREEQAREERSDRPRQELRVTELPPEPEEQPEAFAVSARPQAKRGAPVLPWVFGGLAVAAGGAGGYFGLQSSQSVQDARNAQFADDTARHLEAARGPALVANILFAAAGVAAGATIISLLSGGDDAPAAVTEEQAP